MNGNDLNGINQIEKGVKRGEIAGTIVGIFLFALSVYTFSLAIKVNKLTLKKLKDEGYE
ncbi:MAG: hypothetical protein IPJ01_11065 [Micavibrio sp.]|nr:hypothetical protein [Micavibrio sp.]